MVEEVNHPALRMAFDTANPFPVCEEPVDAARTVLPMTVAVAIKDVEIYPNRSNDVTIWGTRIGLGSVDFDTLLPLLARLLPDPDNTTVSIKLRLPPMSSDHDGWLSESVSYLRGHPGLLNSLA